MRRLLLVPLLAASLMAHAGHGGRSSGHRHGSHTVFHGKVGRSRLAHRAFRGVEPCPSTHRTSGPCPGYVVDHVKPLACGGADEPWNMQWQSIPDAKAKDRWERKGCR